MSAIEKSIRDALGNKFTEKKGESRQDYLRRLAKTFDNEPDDAYEKLPDRSQEWLDATNAAIKAQKKTVVDFADADADDIATRFPAAKSDKADKGKASKKVAKKTSKKPAPAPDEDEDDEDEEDEKPKSKKKVAKGKKDKPAKKPKAPKEKKERKPKGPTPMSEYVKLRLKQPKAERAKLLETLSGKGYALSLSSATSLDCHINLTLAEARRQKLDFSKEVSGEE